MSTPTSDSPCPAQLRQKMVEATAQHGYAVKPEVLAAMATVQRHQFVPEATLEHAYDPWSAVVTHRFPDGRSLSCASAPHMVGQMLDQLDVQYGHRVLEIGAGTGYNAALLAELVGPEGCVTTIDIDPDVTAAATDHLTCEGYGDVDVITGDGHAGVPGNAPYDRIVATVSPWDIPSAWWYQLKPAGKIVVPLRWRGHTQTIAFAGVGNHLVAQSMHYCGFVPLVGDSEGERHAGITADGSVKIHWDNDQPVNPGLLRGVLDGEAVKQWSQVKLGPAESWTDLWLWLTKDPGACRLNVAPGVDRAICDPVAPVRSPALVAGSSLAYLASNAVSVDGKKWWELGAIGHGPDGSVLAQELVRHIKDWDEYRTCRRHKDKGSAHLDYEVVLCRKGEDFLSINDDQFVKLPKHDWVMMFNPPKLSEPALGIT